MTNINKILITVVACVLMICIASVSIVRIVTSNKSEDTTSSTQGTADSSDVQTSASTDESTSAMTSDGAVTLPTQTTAPTNVNGSTTAATGENAVLAQAILGKWSDSLGMMGYEFFDDGMVNVTVFDLKQLVGLDFEGSQKLPYTLEGDILTIKFSAYTGSATWKFRVSVSGNELTMYNIEEFSTAVYTRVS